MFLFEISGVTTNSSAEKVDEKYILNRIQLLLENYGAQDFEILDKSLYFKGGSPFKTNSNPLLPISSGVITIDANESYYNILYSLKFNYLLFWCVASLILIFAFILADSAEFTPERIFTGFGMWLACCIFIYFGYFGLTPIRFEKLLSKSTKNVV